MGNYISNNSVYLLARRALMRYNAEERAFKEIEKQVNRPVVAPKYEGTAIDYHRALQGNKEYLSKTNTISEELDTRLKDVFVTSTGLTENIKTTKPLPLQRYSDEHILGYKDADYVPPGKVSLLQAIKILTDYQANPQEWPIEKIADEHKIKAEYAADLVKYYQAFTAHFPKNVDQKKLSEMKSQLKLLGGKES